MKMKITRTLVLRSAFHIGIVALLGFLIFGVPSPAPATVNLDGARYRVTGPYTCENMSVFLIHADEQDPRQFITLAEGLKQGVVKVTEKDQEQVNELQIENTGDDYLFLQEGDRVQGGKQDRTIFTSFVVAPHSGKMPLPAFCVEQSRWTPGAQGRQFANPSNLALAPKQVRCAAKVQKDQGQVWAEVQGQKAVAEMNAYAGNTNSSLNETLDAPKVKALSERFAAALGKALEGKSDAVGVVLVINGKIEEVDCFPNHQLLSLQYPRLVQSYALQASLEQGQSKKQAVPTAAAVCQFMAVAQEEGNRVPASANSSSVAADQLRLQPVGNSRHNQDAAMTGRRNEAINRDNNLEVVESAGGYNCKTEFDGKLVHRQFLSRSQPQGQSVQQRDLQNNRRRMQFNGQQMDNNDVNLQQQINPANNAPPQIDNNARGQGQGQGQGQQRRDGNQ
jgi:hypothetical protein